MNKKFIIFILCLFLLSYVSSNLLGQKCTTVEIRNKNIQKNPKILEEIERINKFTSEWILSQKSSIKLKTVVSLPVVVHVIWRIEDDNISDEQILSQFVVLNNDFRKMNSNFSITSAAFQAIAADTEIEFCLASIDPSGSATNGITRTQTSIDNIGETENWYRTSDGGKDAWDLNRYINIWVCDIGEENLGFATPPGTAFPEESDGLVIGSPYFGTIGTAVNSFPNHLGRTVTHEMGHYLNLEHLWGYIMEVVMKMIV